MRRLVPAPVACRKGPRARGLRAPLAALCALALLGQGRGARGDEALQRRLERESPARVALEAATRTRAYDAWLWVSLSHVARYDCDLEAADAHATQALALDPLAPEAHAARAEALLLQARTDESLAAADRGLALPGARTSSDLWRVRALALVEVGRYEEALEAATRAATLAPYDARAAEALGRAAYHTGRMDLARQAYTLAVELDPRAEEANLRLGNGFGPAVEGRRWEEAPDLDVFRAACLALETGQAERAADLFEGLLRASPAAFKYRLGLGCALAQRRRSLESSWGGTALAMGAYALLPAPEVEGLEQVLPDAAALSPARRHALLVAAAPLRRWWPALVAAGVRHDLLAMSENLSDRESRSDLLDRLTFDGRRYEHLRGAGGQHGATGVEKLDEARELCFHTLAHELAHQALTYGLPPASVARVKVLYARALAEERCLDHYAASNVDEYFAQGYEAFLSHVKRGCLKETQRHTRLELRTRDPELYAFLVEHLDLAHETPAAMAPFLAAVERSAAAGRASAGLPAAPAAPPRPPLPPR
jgi:Flp pilus assembly protein TadD